MLGTLDSIFNNVNYALRKHTEELGKLQEQASSGSTIIRPSDAPADSYRVMALGSQGRSLQNYMDTITEVISTLEISSTVVDEMSTNVAAVETRLTQVLSGTYADQNRQVASQEINDVLEQVVTLANSQRMGQYLFGGARTEQAPYTVQRVNGEIVQVNYEGATAGRDVEVAPGVEASAFIVGDELFREDFRGEPVFPGVDGTGAEAGTGTSTIRGMVWLEVRDNAGVFEMSIDGGASWAALDGTDNQAVTDSSTGRVLYVDTTGINSEGTDLVCIPGTYDVFDTLVKVRDALRSGDSEKLNQLQEQSGAIMGALEQVFVQDTVTVGAKIGSLGQLQNSLEDLKYDAEDQKSKLQEADIAQVAMALARQEALYQISLSAAAKLLSLSLIDFIR